MKTTIYYFVLLIASSIICFSSCNDDFGCTDPSSEYSWAQNQAIELDPKVDSIMMDNGVFFFISEYSITEGQSNLFEYNRRFASCEDIVDSGGGFTFTMMTPRDSTESFFYRDEEILETLAFLRSSGLGATPLQSIKEGEISGTRLDENSWRISIDVVTNSQEYPGDSEPVEIVVEEIFTLE